MHSQYWNVGRTTERKKLAGNKSTEAVKITMVCGSSSRSTPVEFFKVYLSDLSSRSLSLPPAFAVQLERRIPEKAIIKDHTGKIWPVQLEKARGDLVITDGWQDFACHHSLVDGSFLIFKYDGKSQFDVDLYYKNGLKKGQDPIDSSILRSHAKEEKIQTVERRQTRSSTRHKHDFDQTLSDEIPIKSPTSGGLSERKKSEVLRERRGLKSGKRAYVVPKGPYFVTEMTRADRYHLYVPRTYLHKEDIKLGKRIEIWDEEGRKWPVKVKVMKDHRIYLKDGWVEFCTGNNVALGDKCVLEFILTKDRVANMVKAQIVRTGTKHPKF